MLSHGEPWPPLWLSTVRLQRIISQEPAWFRSINYILRGCAANTSPAHRHGSVTHDAFDFEAASGPEELSGGCLQAVVTPALALVAICSTLIVRRAGIAPPSCRARPAIVL
jgi:hypothetical protein